MNKILKQVLTISFILYLLMKTIGYINLHKFYYTGVLDEILVFTAINIVILIATAIFHEIPKLYKDFKELSLNRKIVWIVIMTLLFIKLIFNIMKEIK